MLQGGWQTLVQEVERELQLRIDSLSADCPQRLRDSIAYSLLGGGKRLRPVLCLLTCEALGGNRSKALPFAAALEMIHCYSLIHDDLPAMDDDDLRRGRPTNHIQFDEATAILAGDGLQALAFETAASASLSPDQLVRGVSVLARAAGSEGMVAGQVDDLWAEKVGGGADLLTAIHARKTGAMIRASVQLGAIAASANQSDFDNLTRYGETVGVAFQIADDLLDVESTSENTGKRTGKDQDRGKLTYPGIHGIETSRQMAKQLVGQAIELVRPYGQPGVPLQQLANYIIDRSY